MLENIHFQIISLYIKDYSITYSIRKITHILNINYSNAFKRVKELVEKKILIQEKVGKANNLSFNIQNLEAINMLSFVEQNKKIENPIVYDIVKEAIAIDSFACVGLFGSRASGKATKDSDWDIFIITNKKEVGKIMSRLPYARNIQLQVVSQEEFEESLLSIEETVVKHIVKNKQIIYNPYPFYNIVRKWELIKHAPTQ